MADGAEINGLARFEVGVCALTYKRGTKILHVSMRITFYCLAPQDLALCRVLCSVPTVDVANQVASIL
jgi:hypothetical protein